MMLDRRELLTAGSAVAIAAALPDVAFAQNAFAPKPGAWRLFQITTRIEIAHPARNARAWLPLPRVNEAGWFRSDESDWTTNARHAQIWQDPKYGARLLHLEWADADSAPVVQVTSRIATRDRAVDLADTSRTAPLDDAERRLYLAPTDLIPTDGIVKETADRITANAASDADKARAIYEWVVENTFRDAKVRGCGVGDIAAMLKTGNLGGKCADLNALFVGLARASGLPARDIYGVRVAPSQFGYRSLGAATDNVTKAQHCRAEVYLTGLGWVPVDPADVRKVALEEPPGNLAISNDKVVAARKTLFGAWEGNWLAYNFAHDIALPGSTGPKLEFLMYPQAETAAGRLDCLEPETFAYSITSKEITAT